MNASEIAAALAAQAETVCRHFLPNGRKQGNYWIAGDIDGARGRSFVVRLSGPGRIGKWNDYSTGDHGDLLDIVRHRTRAATVTDAIAHARAFLALPDDPSPPGTRGAPDSWDPTAAARRIWQRCRPLADTRAEAYLRARAIRRCRFPALRFHPALAYRHEDRTERFPALVAAVTEPDGRIHAVHRTYLDPARPAKAAVAASRARRSAPCTATRRASATSRPATTPSSSPRGSRPPSRSPPPCRPLPRPRRSPPPTCPRSRRRPARGASSSRATTTPPAPRPPSVSAEAASSGASGPSSSIPPAATGTTISWTTAPTRSPNA